MQSQCQVCVEQPTYTYVGIHALTMTHLCLRDCEQVQPLEGTKGECPSTVVTLQACLGAAAEEFVQVGQASERVLGSC